MIDDDMALSLVPGEGVVTRIGEVIAVVLRDDEAEPDEVGALLHTVREAAAAADAPGAALGRQVGRLLADDPTGFPAFAIVAPTLSEVLIMLHGRMEATVTVQGEEHTTTGRDPGDWNERRLPAPIESIRLHPTGHGGGADLWTDLRVGTAHGCGFHLRRVGVRARGGDQTAAPGPAPVSFESFPLVGPNAVTTSERRPPLPVATGTPADEGARAAVMVEGIRCARDHHNNPLALYCSRCGIKMVHRTHVLVEGERPPLGVITFEDGSTYPVDSDLVLGREPSVDDRVATDQALAVPVQDERRSVSRAHLAVELDGWDVFAVDLESSNGTFVRPPRSTDWVRLEPNQRYELRTGTTVRLGGREFLFDQHHVA